jgi:hypothetical protein
MIRTPAKASDIWKSGQHLVVGTLYYSLGSASHSDFSDDSGEFGGSITFERRQRRSFYYVDAYEKNSLDFVGTAVLTVTVYVVRKLKVFFPAPSTRELSLDFSKSTFRSVDLKRS